MCAYSPEITVYYKQKLNVSAGFSVVTTHSYVSEKPEILILQLYLFNFVLGVSMATNSLPGGGSISAETSVVRLVLLSSRRSHPTRTR